MNWVRECSGDKEFNGVREFNRVKVCNGVMNAIKSRNAVGAWRNTNVAAY